VKQQPDIAQTILNTAQERGTGKSTCPSEIARMLFPDDWRSHMDQIVREAIRLHLDAKVLITQKGKPVDVNKIKGPIRIRIS